MPLPAGTKLGPYEIVAPIGAGGMGEVYKARDTRLGRDVAIKISSEQFTERFEREARSIAALNHPNICHLYDVGPNYLVMELVDGTPVRGPLPLEMALDYARQIADALEAAHERGIIHRDLKPANILITSGGVIKVLDFGLAKNADAPASDPESSPTMTISPTRSGMILGTAAYMAPEQARGKSVDKRADIWAFGVVVYEILTGKRLFDGETVSDILAEVLKSVPDLREVPIQVRPLLEHCLEKDPKKRLRDIGDFELLLAAGTPAAGTAPAPSRFGWLAWTVAGALALALIVSGVILYNATRPAPLKPLMRLNVEIASETPLTRADRGSMFALSPDGTRLALTLLGADGKVRLHTRLLNQSQVTPLAGTENASSPFFSPDNQWIGFFADGKLKKISVEGGAAVTLCDAPGSRGASWGDDGNIIAALGNREGLSRIPSSGGTPSPASRIKQGEATHRWPQVLPGSQAVLFTASINGNTYDDANIDVISLKTGERKTVQRGGFFPRYFPTSTGNGHLIYLHQNTMFAVPFDPGRLATTGVPAPILEDVNSNTNGGGDLGFAAAASGPGSFVYLPGKGTQGGWSISWVDRSGKTEPLHAPLGSYVTPRFSPDGKRLAFSSGNGQGDDIWVQDLDRDTPSRLSFLPGNNRWPVWTPDGKNIVFSSSNPTAPGLYWIRSDGAGDAQRLSDGKFQEDPYSFSPDGKRLAIYQNGNANYGDIFTRAVEGDPAHPRLGKAELFLGTPFTEVLPAFSPDGRWMAYASNESGTLEVYVRPFTGPGGKWQISTGGGVFPLWSGGATGAGRELLFQTLDRRVMAVSYTSNHTAGGDSFTAGKPRVWESARLQNLGTFSNYDVAPDGKRLAVMLGNTANVDKPATHLTFLLNFFDELRRRAPATK